MSSFRRCTSGKADGGNNRVMPRRVTLAIVLAALAPASAAAEETGLECVCGPLIGWVERIEDDGSSHFVILDFEVTVLDDTPPQAGDDAPPPADRHLAFQPCGLNRYPTHGSVTR